MRFILTLFFLTLPVSASLSASCELDWENTEVELKHIDEYLDPQRPCRSPKDLEPLRMRLIKDREFAKEFLNRWKQSGPNGLVPILSAYDIRLLAAIDSHGKGEKKDFIFRPYLDLPAEWVPDLALVVERNGVQPDEIPELSMLGNPKNAELNRLSAQLGWLKSYLQHHRPSSPPERETASSPEPSSPAKP